MKAIRYYLTGFIFGIALLGMCVAFASTSTKKSKAQPTPKKPVNVKVATAVVKTVPEALSAVGHMKAISQANLSFTLAGKISKILVKKGAVRKGELIMQLDDASDQAQLASDQATYKLSQSTYDRYLKLSKLGDVSKQMLEEKKEAMETAKAAVDKDQDTIKQKKLTAPFDGMLSSTDYSVGSYVAAGQTVTKIVQLSPLKARYTLPASLKSKVKVGQQVTVSTQNKINGHQHYKGKVTYIEPTVNAQSGTLTLDAQVNNPDDALAPGMFVSVQQVVDPNRKLLVIPDIALMTDVKGRYVFVVGKDNKVKKAYVTVSGIHNNNAAVTKGLNPGDVVVTAGQQRLYDGYSIKILNGTSSS